MHELPAWLTMQERQVPSGKCPDCGHRAPSRSLFEWSWLASMVGASPGAWQCGAPANGQGTCECINASHLDAARLKP